MTAPPDYYGLLQVHPTASEEVIKAAFKALAKKHHPDANTSKSSHRMMRSLNEACDVLLDPKKRTEYDAARRASDAAEAKCRSKAQPKASRTADEAAKPNGPRRRSTKSQNATSSAQRPYKPRRASYSTFQHATFIDDNAVLYAYHSNRNNEPKLSLKLIDMRRRVLFFSESLPTPSGLRLVGAIEEGIATRDADGSIYVLGAENLRSKRPTVFTRRRLPDVPDDILCIAGSAASPMYVTATSELMVHTDHRADLFPFPNRKPAYDYSPSRGMTSLGIVPGLQSDRVQMEMNCWKNHPDLTYVPVAILNDKRIIRPTRPQTRPDRKKVRGETDLAPIEWSTEPIQEGRDAWLLRSALMVNRGHDHAILQQTSRGSTELHVVHTIGNTPQWIANRLNRSDPHLVQMKYAIGPNGTSFQSMTKPLGRGIEISRPRSAIRRPGWVQLIDSDPIYVAR